MSTTTLYLIAAAVLGVVVAVLVAPRASPETYDLPSDNAAGEPAATNPDPQADTSTADTIMAATKNLFGIWHPPEKYAVLIAQSEGRHGLPDDLLARLLWQECRYREDIITGRVRSSVGALGIAQFMPATARELGIDPLNPAQAIDGAGRYLESLYRQLGNWTETVAAYNWGIGNVQRKGLINAPRETRTYYTQILADVSNATGQTLA